MSFDREKAAAAAFDWAMWHRIESLFQDGEGMRTADIAAKFGKSPCAIRRVIQTGRRLERFREVSA